MNRARLFRRPSFFAALVLTAGLTALVWGEEKAAMKGWSEPWQVKKPTLAPVKGPSGEIWSDCPVDTAREPVMMYRSMWSGPKNPEVPHVSTRWPITDVSLVKPWGPYQDGPRTRFDSESYPRKAAKLVSDPSVTKKNDGYAIAFEVDGADDVIVRVEDPSGKVIRSLGCGVLGPNAPEPFAKDRLKQEVFWDGKDADGKPAPAGCKVVVGVGLAPKFAGFVAHDRGQPMPYLTGLDVDSKGRVYVAMHTDPRNSDFQMLRYDREGNYVDMVYPSNPDVLDRTGKKLEDVYEMVERTEGKKLPIQCNLWRGWIWKWDQYMKFPFAIGPDGKGHAVEIKEPFTHRPDNSYLNTLIVDDLDNFWLQPYWATGSFGGFMISERFVTFALDKEGNIYVAHNRNSTEHGSTSLVDKSAYSTIVKVDGKTRLPINAFAFNGETPLDTPRHYLGTTGEFLKVGKNSLKAKELEKHQARAQRENHPLLLESNADFCKAFRECFEKGNYDVKECYQGRSDMFVSIEDLAVNDSGDIFVLDGIPRRVKIYQPDGKWIGEFAGLTVNGKERLFHETINIKFAGGDCYLLCSFRDERDKAYLVKLTKPETARNVVWAAALHEKSRFIGIDAKATPRLVWVGNGGGDATFSRIEDRGQTASAPKHFGGVRDGNLIDPWLVAASADGSVFAYDHGRRRVVACKQDGSNWRMADPVPESDVERFVSRYRRFFSGLDFDSRNNIVTPTSLCVDDAGRRLYVNYRPGGWVTDMVPTPTLSPGYAVYDFGLKDTKLKFPEHQNFDEKRASKWISFGHWTGDIFAQIDKSGVLYQTTVNSSRQQSGRESEEEKFVEGVLTRNPDGSIKQRNLIKVVQSSGSVAVDSKGNIYTVDFSPDLDHWFRGELNFGFPNWTGYEAGAVAGFATMCMYRGKMPVYHQPQVIDLVKFGPQGGRRYHDEIWALRGAGYNGKACGCKSNGNMLACDGADRILAADTVHYAVKIIDTAGNLIQRVGCHGNAETLPGPDGNAKDLGFRIIQNVAAAGDNLYIVDRGLRRVAKVRMEYRELKSAAMER